MLYHAGRKLLGYRQDVSAEPAYIAETGRTPERSKRASAGDFSLSSSSLSTPRRTGKTQSFPTPRRYMRMCVYMRGGFVFPRDSEMIFHYARRNDTKCQMELFNHTTRLSESAAFARAGKNQDTRERTS